MRYPDQRSDQELLEWRIGFKQGDWGKDKDGLWWVCLPCKDFGFAALSIGKHEVEEHPDGTITVKPSILANRGDGFTWHGFLEKGIWRTC